MNLIENVWNESDSKQLEKFGVFIDALFDRLERLIIGQRTFIEEVLAAFLVGEHVLTTGVFGLGKNQILETLANSLNIKFNRILYTSDLLPTDVLGSHFLLNSGTNGKNSEFTPGPLFTNILIVDDINHAPPKTQAALLDAMQLRYTTVSGRRYELPKPFFVAVAQSSVDCGNSFPLSDALLDCFLFSLKIDYPKSSDEVDMTIRTTGSISEDSDPVIMHEELAQFQDLIRRIVVPRHIVELAVKIVRKTRPQTKISTDVTQQYVEWGAGPRASQAIVLGSKAFAAFSGRNVVTVEDIERVALASLRSRIKLNCLAQSDGMNVDLLVKKVVREARAEFEERYL